jgi:peptide/nickel transport system substrate-binding protein
VIDIKAVSMASYRGAATISAIAIPPTGTHTESYHAAMEPWLKDFELDTGKRKIKPYNPAVGKEIAEMLRPSHRRPDPEGSQGDSRSPSAWAGGSPNPQAATELLQAAGFTKRGGDWYTPDGKVFTVKIVVEGEARPVMTRAGSMIAQQWRQFGIDAKTDVAQGHAERPPGFRGFRHHHLVERGDLGRPSRPVVLPRQLAFAIRVAPGKPQTPRNWQRWSSPALDKIIEQIRTVGFDDPRASNWARIRQAHGAGNADHSADGLQRLHGDGRDRTGKAIRARNRPYTDPVPNWGNSRAMMVKLKPAK